MSIPELFDHTDNTETMNPSVIVQRQQRVDAPTVRNPDAYEESDNHRGGNSCI